MLTRIRMLDSGPNKNHRRGQVREVDDARAQALIDGKHAVLAIDPEPAEEVIDERVDSEGL